MKSSLISRTGHTFCTVMVALAVSSSVATAQAKKEKEKSKGDAKPAAAKSGSKPAAPAAKFDRHLAANMKLFSVLSRYAQTLSSAKDAATAKQAVTKLETITKDAITAGEELVKLGKPDPEIEMRLAGDADLKMTSQTVAEQTRTAVKSLASNGEVKTILAPAVENFQAALNRVQQAAEEPQGLTDTPAPAPDKTAPAAPVPSAEKTTASRAADATEVPPPPPQ